MTEHLTLSRPYAALARTVSDILSPPVLAAPGLALAVWASGEPGTYRFAALYFLVAVLGPVFYVVWLLKSGRINDFHLPDRRDRIFPFLVSLVCGAIALSFLIYLGAPRMLLVAVLAMLLQTLVLFAITLSWQISIHTATTAGLVTFGLIILGGGAAFLALLVPLVAWARLYLGRHTLSQTIVGAVVGCLSFVVLFEASKLVW